MPAVKDPAYTQWGLVSVNPESLDAGRIQQWNVGVERELGRISSVGVHYVGNKGTRLQSGDLERNQPDPAAMTQLLRSGTEWNWVSDPASAAAAGVRYPYPGFAGTAWMAITPYPQAAAGYGPLFFVGSPLGQSDYHALQLTANKRSSQGVSGVIQLHAVTSARQPGERVPGALDAGPDSGRDADSIGRPTVIGPTDRTHVAKGFVVWSLPFGRGRRFANGGTAMRMPWSAAGPSAPWCDTNQGCRWRCDPAIRTLGGPIRSTRTGMPPSRSRRRSTAIGSIRSDAAAAGNRYFNPTRSATRPMAIWAPDPDDLPNLRGFGGAYEDLGIVKDIPFGRTACR